MSCLRLAVMAMTLIAVLMAACSDDGTGERRLTTTLTGAAEAPGPGDRDGSGAATIVVDRGSGVVCFDVTVAGIAPASAAHIHRAEAGAAGPVVVTIAVPATGTSTGCVEGVDRQVAGRIADKPSEYYVNVHTAEFPDGALRGQLRK